MARKKKTSIDEVMEIIRKYESARSLHRRAVKALGNPKFNRYAAASLDLMCKTNGELRDLAPELWETIARYERDHGNPHCTSAWVSTWMSRTPAKTLAEYKKIYREAKR